LYECAHVALPLSLLQTGKSIGKLVFLAKPDIAEAKLADVETKLRELEVKFYKSLYEEMRVSGLSRWVFRLNDVERIDKRTPFHRMVPNITWLQTAMHAIFLQRHK
jgi:hypothetical protein